ncbi:uncharacterized protein EI90DRAFT_3021050 [Cantharellus anzutake]|uniref:uncharacterized protein n=1 Tax=Cantharellus anzutake TaxID=1750568 RepID=UPI0019033ACE|nr:uncharacterized protein EI90DRAFT_3021050 [Cantharellus anzutake]KAF8318329.1 hypothetical protein EI90DRAFT_3021050 [Cantharellus anzutake]
MLWTSLVLGYTGMTSSCDGSDTGWHTDLNNPMLGPDGNLCDAAEQPGQFVYSPSDEVLCISSPQGDIINSDLPGFLQGTQDTGRPKHTVKLVTRENPLDVFQRQKLAAKTRAGTSANSNQPGSSGNASQATLQSLSKFGLNLNNKKLSAYHGNTRKRWKNVLSHALSTTESDADVSNSQTEPHNIPWKRRKQHRKGQAHKRAQAHVKGADSMRSQNKNADDKAQSKGSEGDDKVNDAPGAKESTDVFREQDALVAQVFLESKKMHGLCDLSSVFTDLVEIEGKTVHVCQVCQ